MGLGFSETHPAFKAGGVIENFTNGKTDSLERVGEVMNCRAGFSSAARARPSADKLGCHRVATAAGRAGRIEQDGRGSGATGENRLMFQHDWTKLGPVELDGA